MYKFRRLISLFLCAVILTLAVPERALADDLVYSVGNGLGEPVGSMWYETDKGTYTIRICYDEDDDFFGVKSKEQGNVRTWYYVTELAYNMNLNEFEVYYHKGTSNVTNITDKRKKVQGGVIADTSKASDVDEAKGDNPSWGGNGNHVDQFEAMKIIFGSVSDLDADFNILEPYDDEDTVGDLIVDLLIEQFIPDDETTAKDFKNAVNHYENSQEVAWERMFNLINTSAEAVENTIDDSTEIGDYLERGRESGVSAEKLLSAVRIYFGGQGAEAGNTTQNQLGDVENIPEITDANQVLDPNVYDVDDDGNSLNWRHWYVTAFYAAAGLEMTGSNNSIFYNVLAKYDDIKQGVVPDTDTAGTMIPLYSSYQNLKNLVTENQNSKDYRKLYEVLSIASIPAQDSSKNSVFSAWFGTTDEAAISTELKEIWANVKTNDNTDNKTLDVDGINKQVKTIMEYGNITNADLKRFSTISNRLRVLMTTMSLNDAALSGDNYKDWIDTYYEDTQWVVRADCIKDTLLPYLSIENTSGPVFGEVVGEDQEYVGKYIMQTLFEIPYFTEIFMKDMNDAIASNTELTNNDLYKAVKSIREAKEELGMAVLDYMWTMELEPDPNNSSGIQYKSLEKIWEAMQQLVDPDAESSEKPDADKPLETGKPMKWFFDYQSGKLSDYYLQGVGYTATLVPMRSNVYSREWIRYLDSEFYGEFYSKWGFNRKALYMDTSSGSVESYFTQEEGEKVRGRTKVCTLRDLVNSKGDVTLYIDDNFYNCAEIQERYDSIRKAWDSSTRAGALDTAMATDDTTADSGNSATDSVSSRTFWWSSAAEGIEEMYGTDFENIVKTGASTNYSKVFYEMMSKLEGSHVFYPEATADRAGNSDNAVLSSGRINYYLNSENAGSEIYSPIQGYAVVSSVYRDADLFNKANSAEIQEPVFMASQTAPYMKNAPLEACQTIFNWAILKNLKDAMPVGYAGNIDMDCPVYMDILGNIVTESGTVVIPAAANATLMNPKKYYDNMFAAGLFAIYGLDYYIPKKDNESSVFTGMMAEAFTLDDSGKYYIAAPRTIGDETKVDISRLSTSSKSTLDVLYQQTWGKLFNMEDTESGYDFDRYFNVCMEVLRGAPIENIDKVAEGIDTSSRIDRAGIVAAAKLEELNDALATGAENTTLYIPNLAFMPGLTYVAMMAFKILMLVVILVSMVTVYFDAVSESLGFHTAWKCVTALLITMLVLFTVPAVFEATYYQSNRALLQDEAIRIAMLNYEKNSAGVEIGVTEVKEPEISSKLYLRLQEIDVPWYELFYDSIFSNSYKSLKKLYEDYAVTHSIIANAPDVEVMNNGVYVDVMEVFDSSSVDLNMGVDNQDIRRLVQTAGVQTTSLSFYSPYYAILDALIQNVNYYNDNPWGENTSDASNGTTGWYSYTVTERKGGKVKTMGLIEPYLTSDKFLYDDNKDPLGLKYIYSPVMGGDMAPDPATAGFYSAINISSMQNSGWFAKGISPLECQKRLDYMTERARRFVANNRELLGKISDDTFLKAMAMSMAIEHNRVFGAASCESLELYNLSNDDLIRLSIADRDEVMINSTLSYPRFVYTVGGSPAVFAAALLSMVMWISGLVKPILVVVAFLTIFVSIFVFRVCMRKEGTSIYGYMITALLLSGTNICYSVMLKASMFLPSLHFTPFMCILVQIVLQIGYMVLLWNVVGTAFRDWRDLGYARYANKTQDMRIGMLQMFSKNKNSNNPFYGGSTKVSDPEKNWGYYDDMMEERKRRSR